MKSELTKYRLKIWKKINNVSYFYTIPVSTIEEAGTINDALYLDSQITTMYNHEGDYIASILLEMWNPELEKWVAPTDAEGHRIQPCSSNKELSNQLRAVYEGHICAFSDDNPCWDIEIDTDYLNIDEYDEDYERWN